MVIESVLATSSIDSQAEFARFLEGMDDEGAVVTFVGLARPRSGSGAQVERLILDHHPRLTAKSLDEIARCASDRFDVSAVKVVHRCGEVTPGEAIVFVAAASAHRRAAFDAADYMMDRLKTDATFWKRGDTVNGSRWIEPTQADHAERRRWSD